jgi:hypothetical protein
MDIWNSIIDWFEKKINERAIKRKDAHDWSQQQLKLRAQLDMTTFLKDRPVFYHEVVNEKIVAQVVPLGNSGVTPPQLYDYKMSDETKEKIANEKR